MVRCDAGPPGTRPQRRWRPARCGRPGEHTDRVVRTEECAACGPAGGYHHHLATNTWAAHAQVAGEEDARLLDWEVVLPDAEVRAAANSLERAGHAVDWMSDEVIARDPWGTAVRLVPARPSMDAALRSA